VAKSCLFGGRTALSVNRPWLKLPRFMHDALKLRAQCLPARRVGLTHATQSMENYLERSRSVAAPFGRKG